jgi:hypothetical protein
MNGRFVSELSPAERAHLDYLEAQTEHQRRHYGGSPCPPADGERVAVLRRWWADLVEDSVRREQELLSSWAGHHPIGVRRGRDAAAVALAALAGLVLGVLAQLLR